MRRIIFFLFSFFFFLFANLSYVFAACPPCPTPNDVCTALGCIPSIPTNFVAWLLARAISLGGGIAFLLMIFGGFKIITSSGNPEAVKVGQELITSALMGLIFIIFSVFLLQLIGVKILQIPGFGTP